MVRVESNKAAPPFPTFIIAVWHPHYSFFTVFNMLFGSRVTVTFGGASCAVSPE